jgi:integrase
MTFQPIPEKPPAPSSGGNAIDCVPSLADLQRVLSNCQDLSVTRRRDLLSAVARVAGLLGEEPERVPLDLKLIAEKLGGINPAAAGLTPKTLSNIRSDFMAAVRASGLHPVAAPKASLSADWAKLLEAGPDKRVSIGLSRLARYASASGIRPADIDDVEIERFISSIRSGSLHPNANKLHREIVKSWNLLATSKGDVRLYKLEKPCFRGPPKRLDWLALPETFRSDVEKHLAWCEGRDVFAADARPRALAPRTVKLRRNQIHAAATALVASGVAVASIASIADLVSTDAFRRILQWRHTATAGEPNAFNRDLAEALIQVAREWVKIDQERLKSLKQMARKVPIPASGLTAKNKKFLRQFDDPAMLSRLRDLPAKLWRKVKRDQTPSPWTLCNAQAALAIGILIYIPLRLQNLAMLRFDTHVFLRNGARVISTLELGADEVKNKRELAFDIPNHLAQMLIEYRDRIAPKVLGRRPDWVFTRADGKAKSQAMIAVLIQDRCKKAGFDLTAHQFRHLSAKIILDAEPGNFEVARQLLGHKSQKITATFYGGVDSRRAGRHHQRLIDAALAEQLSIPRRRKSTKF